MRLLSWNVNGLRAVVSKNGFEWLKSKNIDFYVEVKSNLQGLQVEAWELCKVLSNLIDNAIKHSYKNSVIKVNLYKDKNNILLDIINNGNDIPSDECDKIFERFYRSDKSRNRKENI